MRGVILAGGFGTRMAPFTETITNKHLAPLYSPISGAIPMIDYPIDTLINLGIDDILVITSQDHCGDIVKHLGDGFDRGVSFTYKIQEMRDPNRPAGIASALKLAKDFTGDENFAVILGDNFFEWGDSARGIMYDGCKMFNERPAMKCMLTLKKTDEWDRFGVAVIKQYDDNTQQLTEIVEKPTEFISDLAVTGLYFYTPEVYDIADTLKPSKRGELEISDINNYYCKTENAGAILLDDLFWSDMGTPESMIQTQEFINGK